MITWALEHPWLTFFLAGSCLSVVGEVAKAIAAPRCIDCRRKRLQEENPEP